MYVERIIEMSIKIGDRVRLTGEVQGMKEGEEVEVVGMMYGGSDKMHQYMVRHSEGWEVDETLIEVFREGLRDGELSSDVKVGDRIWSVYGGSIELVKRKGGRSCKICREWNEYGEGEGYCCYVCRTDPRNEYRI